MQLIGHTLYLTTLLLLTLIVSATALLQVQSVILAMGVIGLWRYCWAATNLARAAWYLRVAFPRMKARVLGLHAARKTAPVSVVKNGLPVPPASTTTRPLARWLRAACRE